jgi:hypothetical protein
MTKVDRNIVEREVSQMFDEHKTTQSVIDALLIEIGWDATTIRGAQEARAKKQRIEKEREEKREAKKKKKESPQALIQQLAAEQKAEQVQDKKSTNGSRRTLPLVIAVKEVLSDDETETEKEEIEESDERTDEEVLAEYGER